MSKEGSIDVMTGQHLTSLEQKGVSRRDFLKFCTAMAASMGLPSV